MTALTGRCLCEAIAYEITCKLGPIVNCHCSKCRRWHGAAFRTRASVPVKHFKWLKGEKLLSYYRSSKDVTKTFCSICGSCLVSYRDDHPEFLGLPLGGLEQDPGVKPTANIYVGSKAPWYELTDELPQYDELPETGNADLVAKTSED